jgi:hypothetical protein
VSVAAVCRPGAELCGDSVDGRCANRGHGTRTGLCRLRPSRRRRSRRRARQGRRSPPSRRGRSP